MIKAHGVMHHLDGDFKRDYPAHERFTHRDGAKWFIVERGPRYVNQFEVIDFDAAGEAGLLKHERAEEPV